MQGWLASTAVKAGIGKTVGLLPRLAADEYVSSHEKLMDRIKPRHIESAPEEINFAELAQRSYKEGKEREVKGFDILNQYSSPDRVVYKHQDTGHVVISFRGTDLKNWKDGFSSKGFRDVSTDLLLGSGSEGLSHRFYNAEQVTQKVINEFGKHNVSVTGHSLGGSQAMHVSRKYDLHGHVYNPHTTWSQALTGGYYPQVTLHVNESDPVSMFYHGASFKKVDKQKHGFFLKAHGLENFVKAHPKYSEKLSRMQRLSPNEYAMQ